MKKLTFILLFSLLVSSSLFAQVSVGIKAGGALSGHAIEGDSQGEGDFKPTYLGGVFVSVPLTDNFSLQPEVLYINKGNQGGIPGFTQRYNLHYINLPIMLQYHVLDRLTVELGPELGYLLSTGDNSGFVISNTPSFDDRLLASYQDLDVALNVGVGYMLSDRWSVNVRYNLGIRDISDDFTFDFGFQDEPVLYSNTTYNRSVQLSVGFRLF